MYELDMFSFSVVPWINMTQYFQYVFHTNEQLIQQDTWKKYCEKQ